MYLLVQFDSIQLPSYCSRELNCWLTLPSLGHLSLTYSSAIDNQTILLNRQVIKFTIYTFNYGCTEVF